MTAEEARAETYLRTNTDYLIVTDLVCKVEREIERAELYNKHSALVKFPELYSCDHRVSRGTDGKETQRMDKLLSRVVDIFKNNGFIIERAQYNKSDKSWFECPSIVISWFI